MIVSSVEGSISYPAIPTQQVAKQSFINKGIYVQYVVLPNGKTIRITVTAEDVNKAKSLVTDDAPVTIFIQASTELGNISFVTADGKEDKEAKRTLTVS